MKNLTVLGSTGSIGTNVLKIVEMFPDRFVVKALTAKSSIARLAQQIAKFRPEMTAVHDEQGARLLADLIPAGMKLKLEFGDAGYEAAARYASTDVVVTAVVGAAGLKPTIAAIESGKTIALANKETLVMAGEFVMKLARQKRVSIIPIDSEHSAIFQCLMGQTVRDLDKILITASGGPFLETPADRFPGITPEAALKHPNWQMGNKITIDSATLMNKGFEVIEAKHLFDVELSKIRVVIHPQSIIHSMVAFRDGSVLAQLGIPDMKGAIAFALSYPQRLPLAQPLPDFAQIGRFTFKDPDLDKFKCLALALQAGRTGGTLPAVLNAANEIAVGAFLEKRLSFDRIPFVIERTMASHAVIDDPALDDIFDADLWARRTTERCVQKN